MSYTPESNRYDHSNRYGFCGKSGLVLPKISLGLWHNFGELDDHKEAVKMLHYAFDQGITHFDLANNYGTPAGSAETNFGKILKESFHGYRDEMIISSKAGHYMWPGPYGDGGSRKYLFASIDQSLKRMGLEYVDIFYSHRYDHNTPLEETMRALSDIVKQGKALYVGISKYPKEKATEAYKILEELGTPCLIYQGRYSIFQREVENETFPDTLRHGVGFIGFSPLYQGILTDKYIKGIPQNSRAAQEHGFLKSSQITIELIEKVKLLNKIAEFRGQTLAQMALSWCFHQEAVNSVIIGASSVNQIEDNLKALDNIKFTDEELWNIGEIAG